MTISNGSAAERLTARTARPVSSREDERLLAQLNWVRAVARNLVRDPWRAEDITQETLLAALAAPPSNAGDDRQLRAWLARVAFNLSRLGARQLVRSRARERRVARPEALPSVTDTLAEAGVLRELARALSELPEPYQEVVRQRYFEGLSTAEIAARSGASELAVRKRLWRARGKLRAALEPETPFFAGLLAWLPRALARPRTQLAAGLAAGVAVSGSLWFLARGDDRPSAEHARLAAATSGAFELQDGPWPASDALLQTSGDPRQGPARRTWTPPRDEPEPREPESHRAPPRESAHILRGVAFELDGAPFAGGVVVASTAPDTSLGLTSAQGSFEVRLLTLPVSLEVHAEGWTTVAPGEYSRATADDDATLVVAPSAPLHARVVDALGRGLGGAVCALRADDSAWTRIPRALRLSSDVRATFVCDASGALEIPELARGRGLWLLVAASGCETREWPTEALGSEELFQLAAPAPAALVNGTVRHQDGRAAGGARVRLGESTAVADALGRFQLAVHGFHPGASLEASDDGAESSALRGFGARLAAGQVTEVDLTLGEEHDPVSGLLEGPEPGGWLVAAFALELSSGVEPDPCPVLATSDARGRFELSLRRGTYDVHALAPGRLRAVHLGRRDTRSPGWSHALPAPAALAQVSGRAQGTDGQALAGAEVQVCVELAGARGRRTLPWRALATDDAGAFAFEAEEGLALALAVEHPSAVAGVFALRAGEPARALTLARPAFVQLAGAERADACAVLDPDGRVLEARGPVRGTLELALHDGRSPVVAVPEAARWLELRLGGALLERLPILPRAGEVLEFGP